MLAGLLNLLGGGIIRQVISELNQAYKTRLQAQNSSERIRADKIIAELEMRKSVLVAESRYRWNIAFRTFLAMPFGLYMAKIIIFDKILKLGVTDDLSASQWKLAAVVYGFYFVYETAQLFKR